MSRAKGIQAVSLRHDASKLLMTDSGWPPDGTARAQRALETVLVGEAFRRGHAALVLDERGSPKQVSYADAVVAARAEMGHALAIIGRYVPYEEDAPPEVAPILGKVLRKEQELAGGARDKRGGATYFGLLDEFRDALSVAYPDPPGLPALIADLARHHAEYVRVERDDEQAIPAIRSRSLNTIRAIWAAIDEGQTRIPRPHTGRAPRQHKTTALLFAHSAWVFHQCDDTTAPVIVSESDRRRASANWCELRRMLFGAARNEFELEDEWLAAKFAGGEFAFTDLDAGPEQASSADFDQAGAHGQENRNLRERWSRELRDRRRALWPTLIGALRRKFPNLPVEEILYQAGLSAPSAQARAPVRHDDEADSDCIAAVLRSPDQDSTLPPRASGSNALLDYQAVAESVRAAVPGEEVTADDILRVYRRFTAGLRQLDREDDRAVELSRLLGRTRRYKSVTGWPRLVRNVGVAFPELPIRKILRELAGTLPQVSSGRPDFESIATRTNRKASGYRIQAADIEDVYEAAADELGAREAGKEPAAMLAALLGLHSPAPPGVYDAGQTDLDQREAR